MLECAAIMLIDAESILLERRTLARGGIVTIPGGHVEPGETPEQALRRELMEEMALVPSTVRFVCTLLYQGHELQRVHYYAVEAWTGAIENNEAEELIWSSLNEPERLDLPVDRIAVAEYLRLYRQPG